MSSSPAGASAWAVVGAACGGAPWWQIVVLLVTAAAFPTASAAGESRGDRQRRHHRWRRQPSTRVSVSMMIYRASLRKSADSGASCVGETKRLSRRTQTTASVTLTIK